MHPNKLAIAYPITSFCHFFYSLFFTPFNFKYQKMKINHLLSGVLALCILTSCTKHTEEKEEAGKFLVTNPLQADTSFTKEYVAQIQSFQNVELHAMVKGYLESIKVDEGQQVKAGEVLFTINPKEYQAELAKAKADLKTAEIEWQNVKNLNEKNIVSNTEVALAQSKFELAKAEMERAALFVSFTEIKAPFDGTIDRIKFKAGSLIDEGTLLTSISNNKNVYAYFNVSELDYLDYKARVTKNQKDSAALLLANNKPHAYKGTIEVIEGEFDNSTGTIAFRAKFPNPDLLLRHGQTGKIQLTMPIIKALLVPQKATFELQDKIYVYVVDQNNIVKAKSITIKQKMANLYVVEAGVLASDKILLEGLQSVKEDDKIQTTFTPIKQVIENLQLIKN